MLSRKELWAALVVLVTTTTTEAQQSTCVDSASWHKTGDPSKDCSWVRQKSDTRCRAKGIAEGAASKTLARYSCARSCESACADDVAFHKKDDEDKNCAWVSAYAPRCRVRGDDNVVAADACPVACELPLTPRKATFASCRALANARPAWLKATEARTVATSEELAPRAVKRLVGGTCDNYGSREPPFLPGIDAPTSEGDNADSPSFSDTNNQEADVDEADVVKATDDVLFVASATRQDDEFGESSCEYRLSAVSGDALDLLSSVPLASLQTTPSDMLLSGDVLLVIGTAQLEYDDPAAETSTPWYLLEPAVVLLLFDVSDPTNPTLLRRLTYEGTYVSARHVDGTAYVVVSKQAAWGLEPAATVPYFRDETYDDLVTLNATTRTDEGDEEPMEPIGPCESVGYVWPSFDELQDLTVIVALDVQSPTTAAEAAPVTETVATRVDRIVYASKTSLYLTQQQWVGTYRPFVSDVREEEELEDEWASPSMRTFVLKFSLTENSVAFETTIDVPGTPINQFALSETSSGDYFRIATTARSAWNWAATSNGVFVFDAHAGAQVGAVTHLAPGESIFAARFVGDDLCYLVTFVQVDPLFAIDLSDPTAPTVTAELKVPGFSNYLHPLFFDDDDKEAILGLGRDVDTSLDVPVNQGLQLSLFDVSDKSSLERVAAEVIGDRGSDSAALSDHKAIFIAKEETGSYLFAFPATVADLNPRVVDDDSPWAYGIAVFQGALVFRIASLLPPDRLAPVLTLDALGNVTHLPDDFFTPVYVNTTEGQGYWQTWFDTETSGFHLRRILQRGDFLYTVSDNSVLKSALLASPLLAEDARVHLNDPALLQHLSWTGPAVV